jgi:phosphoribosylcarboxyaminoimidazole (NCAIR) mutase
VQMPPGVPVATVGIGPAGATNAALLAVQILAINDKKLAEKLGRYKDGLARSVREKNEKLQQNLE